MVTWRTQLVESVFTEIIQPYMRERVQHRDRDLSLGCSVKQDSIDQIRCYALEELLNIWEHSLEARKVCFVVFVAEAVRAAIVAPIERLFERPTLKLSSSFGRGFLRFVTSHPRDMLVHVTSSEKKMLRGYAELFDRFFDWAADREPFTLYEEGPCGTPCVARLYLPSYK